MKAVVNTTRTFSWFDAGGVVVNPALLTAKVFLDNTLVASFTSLTQHYLFPDLYSTTGHTFLTAGTYTFTVLYDGTAVDSRSLQIFLEATSDVASGAQIKPRLAVSDFSPGANMALRTISPSGTVSSVVNVTYKSALAAYEADAATTFAQDGVWLLLWHEDTGSGDIPARLDEVFVGAIPGKELAAFVAQDGIDEDSPKHVGATVVVSSLDGVQLAIGVTGVDGVVTLNVPPGAARVALVKDGVVFTSNNWAITVANLVAEPIASNAFVLNTSAFSVTVTSPAAPVDTCEVYVTLYDATGTPLRHADIKISVQSYAQVASGAGVVGTTHVFSTDSNGYAAIRLVQGVQVEVSIPAAFLRRVVTVPAETTANLFTLVSAAPDVFTAQTLVLPAAPRRSL